MIAPWIFNHAWDRAKVEAAVAVHAAIHEGLLLGPHKSELAFG